MALGKTKEDILNIIGEITFSDIKAAIEYLYKNNVTPRGETSYFMKKGEKIGYSFNQIIKTINNGIKKNKTILKTGEVDTFEIYKIFDSIDIPSEYELIFPWNERGKEQIKTIRNNVLDYAKNLGYELNDEPKDYTALRISNRNFAEIHYPDRDSKIRVDVFYDKLPQTFRNKFGKKLERYPDTHNYALNGKFLITLAAKTVEQIKEIIKYSYEHRSEILNKEPIEHKKGLLNVINQNPHETISNNQILYGPPGTGKTYNTVVEAMKILNKEMYLEYENLDLFQRQDFYKNKLEPEFNRIKDEEKRIEFVTFHQSYSYEEFVEGIKPFLSEWGEANVQDVKYVGKDGIFKKICQRAEKELYQKNDSSPIEYASFENVLEEFKNKYPAGNDFDKLHNLKYSEKFVEYQFGQQEQYRKIELDKIKEMFNKEYEYDTAIEFNNDYDGNSALACYNYAFYKELNNIRNEINAGIQRKINKNDSGEFEINKQAPKYVLIIDEINRGNISKIFGELITLIEEDKRGKLKVKLPYSQKEFSVPENLYIIGTMNTSDRSIASIDIALRRRFTFKEIMPQKDLVPNISVFGLNLRDIFTVLNERISILLDRDHQIGHSYFMKLANSENIEADFQRIWFDCIMPLLNEYFYGDWEKLRAILGETQKDGESSFIKKTENVKFAIKYDCDDDDKYDFVKETEPNFDFKMALENAFLQKSDKSKDENSGEQN